MDLSKLKRSFMCEDSFEYDNQKVEIINQEGYKIFIDDKFIASYPTLEESRREAIAYLDDKYITIYERLRKKLREAKTKLRNISDDVPTFNYKGFNVFIYSFFKGYRWKIVTEKEVLTNNETYDSIDKAKDSAKDYINLRFN